jgi:radical SAM superfamily enzyme YgiQ (UPF0313 family)
MEVVKVVLVSTYDLGRQPFGLASPAAWLRAEGHEVAQADISRGPLPEDAVAEADLAAFFLPMHTATRLALRAIERVRKINPRAALCAYGLYAPMNEAALRAAGVTAILGGEFEQEIVDWVRRAGGSAPAPEAPTAAPALLPRLQFLVPDRTGLPPLDAYAQLATPEGSRRVGYVEASRGCKHLCRHCPVVPVYQGAFRVVQREVVLEDVRRQVTAGAEHITFGDPDFLNGPAHAMTIAEALGREWPGLTYDVTVKIEHLLKHCNLLPRLKATGCLFVTSAVESLDDAVLEKLAKGHTRAGFEEALRLMRAAGLPLAPTFIPFTPWTTLESYRAFLRALADLDLAADVAPIQLAIRLLIPNGSLLLDLPDVRALVGPFDAAGLCYPWRNEDPAVDALCTEIHKTIKRAERLRMPRRDLFRTIWDLAEPGRWPVETPRPDRVTIPYLTEPWYC